MASARVLRWSPVRPRGPDDAGIFSYWRDAKLGPNDATLANVGDLALGRYKDEGVPLDAAMNGFRQPTRWPSVS
jgi:hypothetical protein